MFAKDFINQYQLKSSFSKWTTTAINKTHGFFLKKKKNGRALNRADPHILKTSDFHLL